MGYVEVEVEEILPATLFKEGSYVVGIILEERGLAICRHESLPVEVTPVAVVGDAYVAHGTFHAVITLYRHGEGLRTIGRGNDATVAVGLLHKVVVLLYDATVTVDESFGSSSSCSLFVDYRDAIRPKHPLPDAEFEARPYYQVRAQRHGFLPNLSVLDLLFNEGPEGIFWLL